MKKLRSCYDQLSPEAANLLREMFMKHFECSKNTFYRVLDDSAPSLKYVRWFSENAGFFYDSKKDVFVIDTQFSIQTPTLKKVGLALV